MAGFKVAKARRIWNTLAVGTKTTTLELLTKLTDPNTVREDGMYKRCVSSYLSQRVARRQAAYDSKVGRCRIYKKLGDDSGRMIEESKPLTKEPPEFNELQLGRSILAIIEDLKAKLRMEKETIRDMVHQTKELQKLYRQAQQRILELNQGDRAKSFKLDELQNVVNGK